MRIRVELVYDYGYAWYTSGGVSVKGYAFDRSGRLLKEEALAACAREAEDPEQLLKGLNGMFALIVHKDERIWFAADRNRSFPLFYRSGPEGITVSDAAYSLRGAQAKLDETAAAAFLHTGYAPGSRTLLRDVCQVQAGEYITSSGGETVAWFYHLYAREQTSAPSFDELAGQLSVTLKAACDRLILAAAGRTIVLPLSGGYDSRLLAALLSQAGYPKVVCFTYGFGRGREVRLSHRVAEKLGFDWHFVPYTDANLTALADPAELDRYITYCTNASSGIFLQDFFAVKYLLRNGLIPEDAVIVPGHTGDFISGGHLEPGLTDENLADRILNRHFALRRGADTGRFRSLVEESLYLIAPADNFENWNLKERQAKFIINSNRAYEFFGMQHLIPLWDAEVVAFFQNAPYACKLGRKLYDHVLFRDFFRPGGIAFGLKPRPFLLQKLTGAYNRAYRRLVADQYNFRFTAAYLNAVYDAGVPWSSRDININAVQAAWLEGRLRQMTEADGGPAGGHAGFGNWLTPG